MSYDESCMCFAIDDLFVQVKTGHVRAVARHVVEGMSFYLGDPPELVLASVCIVKLLVRLGRLAM